MFKLDSENEKCFFYVKDNMMYERGWYYNSEGHRVLYLDGDSLARTSWAYLCYGDESLKKGIESCYHLFDLHGKSNYYVSRNNQMASYTYIDHPDMKHFTMDNFLISGLFTTTSRDQVLYSLAAMKLRGHDEWVTKITKKLPTRLSLRYAMTPDYKTWVNDLAGHKINIPLHFFSCILHYLSAKIWNPFIDKFVNSEKISKYLGNSFNVELSAADLKVYAYSWNLMVYMIISSKRWFGLRKFFSKILLKSIVKENILYRLLLGDETVTDDEIKAIKPCKDYQWMRYQNKEDHVFIVPLTQEEASYNTFDVDALDIAKEIGRQMNENKNEWIKI